MLCALTQRDGKWYCTNCTGRPLKGDYKRQCKASADLPSPVPVNPTTWFTNRYTKLAEAKSMDGLPTLAELLAKLERCKAAGCEHLDNGVCGLGRWSACKRMEHWFSKLMGGGCVHWATEPNSLTLTLILGPHRTLSSCLAEMLEKLGVFLGARTPGGECLVLTKILERAMKFPSTVPSTPPGDFEEAFRAWLANHTQASAGRPMAAKYPTLAAFRDDVLAVTRNVRIIRIRRPLEESIASLVYRSAKYPTPAVMATPAECGDVQRYLDAAADDWPDDIPHCEIHVADLLAKPIAVVQQVCDFLDIQPTARQKWDAVTHVRPSLALHTDTDADDRWTKDTTVCIKTFERPECLDVCIRSVRDRYPSAKILVADDSREPTTRTDVEVLRLPYDVGLSAGRNRMFEHATTEYVLLLDDDMIFTTDSDVQRLRDTLDRGIDIASGQTIGMDGRDRKYLGRFQADGDTLSAVRGTAGQHDCGLPAYHVIENCYVAKREVLLRAPYNEEYKVGEHLDWLLECWEQKVRITCVNTVTVLDFSLNVSSGYSEARRRANAWCRLSVQRRCDKLGFTRFVRDLYEGQSPKTLYAAKDVVSARVNS